MEARTLYKAFDRLRRAHRRLAHTPADDRRVAPWLSWCPSDDRHRAVVLLHMAEALKTKGHRDPTCLWSA